MFGENSFACYSKADYEVFESHLENKEITLAQAMLNDYTCILLPTDQQYKVLSAEYKILSQYLQIMNAASNDANYSMWTIPTNAISIHYARQ